jgi:hypothetical protein
MKSLVVYEFGVASIELKQLWESENWENIPIHPVVHHLCQPFPSSPAAEWV